MYNAIAALEWKKQIKNSNASSNIQKYMSAIIKLQKWYFVSSYPTAKQNKSANTWIIQKLHQQKQMT